jgi:hypothetical protein
MRFIMTTMYVILMKEEKLLLQSFWFILIFLTLIPVKEIDEFERLKVDVCVNPISLHVFQLFFEIFCNRSSI